MNVISKLGSIKSKHTEFFSEAHTDVEEEEPIAEDDIADEDEETPDLLRNSTLGMYDVEDIEDEYDDGEDEFYDDDIEIVYSDDDDVDDIDIDGDDGQIEVIDENFDTDDEMDIGDISIDEGDSELDEAGSDAGDADIDEDDSIHEGEMYDDYYDDEDSEDVSESESNEGRQFNDIIEILSDMDSENEADNGEVYSENSDEDEDDDDDSAIIDEWLEHDTANRRRRSDNYYRNFLDGDAPSTSDDDQLRDDDELDGDDTDVLRYDINPFIGQERGGMGDSVLPNTVQMLVNELDANGNNHLRRLPIRMDGMFPSELKNQRMFQI
ncbi:unnamed protein product [[Candida] boidinii]|nr:unnamed protein product [[Candida] boidinii]